MAKLNLILADVDKNYVQGLANYMLSNYNEKFNITCLTNKDLFIEELKSIRKKDVLVVGKSFYINKIENLGIRSVLILGEGNIDKSQYEYPIISKYQPGDDICKEILRIYTEYNPKNIERVSNSYSDTKIITFYSPAGGSGKSTLAAATAMMLAKNGDDILYLNLEDIQTTKAFFKGENDYTLSDLIFFVKEKEENFEQKLKDSLIRDNESNVLFFNPTESILDIEDIEVEDIKWLIEELYKINMFRYVIIDTSSKYNSVYNIIIGSSSYVVVPVLRENSNLEKLKIYIDNNTEINKCLFLYNKTNVGENINEENIRYLASEGVDLQIQIPRDNELSFMEGISIINSPAIYGGTSTIINALAL